MEFMGINNVTDAKAILGKDGCADGFEVSYTREKRVKRGKREFVKEVPCKKVIWVREFDPNSVGNDGSIHGFGRGTVYSKKSSSKKVTAKSGKITISASEYARIMK